MKLRHKKAITAGRDPSRDVSMVRGEMTVEIED